MYACKCSPFYISVTVELIVVTFGYVQFMHYVALHPELFVLYSDKFCLIFFILYTIIYPCLRLCEARGKSVKLSCSIFMSPVNSSPVLG